MTRTGDSLVLCLLLALISSAFGTGYPYHYSYTYPTYNYGKGAWQNWDGNCQGTSCQKDPHYPQYPQYPQYPEDPCPYGYQQMADKSCGCANGHGSYVYPSMNGYPSQAPICYGWTGYYSNGYPYIKYKYKYRKMGYQWGQDSCKCFPCPDGHTCEGGAIYKAACRPHEYNKPICCKGQPQKPANAKDWRKTCKDAQSGRKCSCRCMPGYIGKPKVEAECRPDGTWVVTGTCEQQPTTTKCSGSPTEVAHSNGWDNSCTDKANGATCSATCKDGYTGAPKAKCVKNKWKVTGSCSQGGGGVGCAGTPPTANNALDFDSTCTDGVEGNECSADCVSGYTGTASAVCSGGKWKVSSTCSNGDNSNATCAGYPPATTAVAPWTEAVGNCQAAPVDEICSNTCATGADGTYAEATCTASGVWTVDTDCTLNTAQAG